ncbi:MAG: carbon-nitrogen hydrolase family protein [Jiangellaceae bacterium]|nr:carbon-nitrogen hydrolase family protein [Jiangellaceae bacterium]
MQVALVQFAATTDPVANLELADRLLKGFDEADLALLPEAAMHDFGPPELPLGPVAQPLDGPFVAGLAAIARSRGAAVIAGMFERADDPDRPYNTLVVIGADGALLASYRKTHLFDSFGHRESDKLSPGRPHPVTVDLAGVRVGLLTCYDLRFPEQARALVDAGAQLLAIPAAWVSGPLKEDQWTTLLRARAIENTVYVAGAAQCGPQYCGRSALVDPMGVVVAGLVEAEGVVSGPVELDRVTDVRERNPALQHRRWTVVPRD